MPTLDDPDIVARARRALDEAGPLCDHCLGRLFAKVETGMTHPERAVRLRAALGVVEPTRVAACALCEGLFDELDAFAALVRDALAEYEFDTYLVGSKVDAEPLAREKALWESLGIDTGEPMNTEVNREVGKRLTEWRPHAKVDFKDPHVTAILDTRFDHVALQHGGLFLYGRYRKLERGIPQTIWPCGRCRGRGCDRCAGTGKQYPTSVQELVAAAPLRASGATESAFHGAGREDVDARCLGTGRPFVLELKDPRVRTLDLPALEREVNAEAAGRVEVEGLRVASKGEVVRVKDFHGRKTYRARVAFESPVSAERLKEAIAALRARPIAQRTPSRVEHRRADKVRDRLCHDVALEEHAGGSATLVIDGDAGLYIKELVSGDEGRTSPSLAALLGVPARVQELDVLAVEYDEAGAMAPAPR